MTCAEECLNKGDGRRFLSVSLSRARRTLSLSLPGVFDNDTVGVNKDAEKDIDEHHCQTTNDISTVYVHTYIRA